jgi:D-alanyl-lipoteichoic acid acyltransferase DltB (MBOAT superfamily)
MYIFSSWSGTPDLAFVKIEINFVLLVGWERSSQEKKKRRKEKNCFLHINVVRALVGICIVSFFDATKVDTMSRNENSDKVHAKRLQYGEHQLKLEPTPNLQQLQDEDFAR